MNEYLALWADDLFLHAHDLLRWITDYVDLEESLAVGSMAQEDLAHAAALLAATGIDGDARHERIFTRPLSDWAPSTLIAHRAATWPDTVARSVLFSEAVSTLIDQLRQHDAGPLGSTAKVIAAEQSLHMRHWHRWTRILARDRRTGDEFLESLERRSAQSNDLFAAPSGHEAPAGLSPSELRSNWEDRVGSSMVALGVGEVTIPEATTPRQRLVEGSEMAQLLKEIRWVRDTNPDRRYEIYS